MMIKCWELKPEERPSFQELHDNTSSYAKKIAGHIEMTYNPFEGADGNTLQEKEEEEVRDMSDPEIAIQVYSSS